MVRCGIHVDGYREKVDRASLVCVISMRLVLALVAEFRKGYDGLGRVRVNLDRQICGKAGATTQHARLTNTFHTIYNLPHFHVYPSPSSPPPIPSQYNMSYSPIHKSSLVPAATHPQALLDLVDQKLSRPIIGKFASFTLLRLSLKRHPRIPHRLCRRDSRLCFGSPLTFCSRSYPLKTRRGFCLHHNGQQRCHSRGG
jgi:hypothetical protein